MRTAGIAERARSVTIAIGLFACCGVVAARAQPIDSVTAVLTTRLKGAGRAEVAIERIGVDPMTGNSIAVRGRLALEPPSRTSLEFQATGERLTLREDGGEWLEPELRQMLRIAPGQAAAAFRWWGLLLDGSGFSARRIGERRWLVRARADESALADSAWITLGGDGLPVRLEVEDSPGSRSIYRFRDWRFVARRGRSAFVIRAPVDYQVVDLP